ncbi:MAG: 4-(cytidine 5'-diphospho)-2-C-methyl-D-erythritol kinase [Myxococcota bacterium]
MSERSPAALTAGALERVEVRAPAKLNVGLRLLSRRSDGYHEIETVFVPLDLCDELRLEWSLEPGIELRVRGAELPTGSENLAVRAAEAACSALEIEPRLRIELEKRIPVAAGLGGGSSDAAAVLLGVEALAGRALSRAERAALALELGADVPFFLEPCPALGRGRGERLEPLEAVAERWWVLVALPFGISTAWAYRAASAELTLPREPSSIAALLGPWGLPSSPSNDLEAVAERCHPQIGALRRALERAGAAMTGMSGSGPTVFGGFEKRGGAEAAAREVALPEGARAMAIRSPSSRQSRSSDNGWGVAKW